MSDATMDGRAPTPGSVLRTPGSPEAGTGIMPDAQGVTESVSSGHLPEIGVGDLSDIGVRHGNAGSIRRGRQAHLDHRQILNATSACFAESGYDGTTIRAIAQRIDCSVGSIYRYFSDKRELLLACAGELFKGLIEQLEDGRIGFDASRVAYERIAGQHGQMYRLMFWLWGEGLPRPIERVVEVWERLLSGREAAVQAWGAIHAQLTIGMTDGIEFGVAVKDGEESGAADEDDRGMIRVVGLEEFKAGLKREEKGEREGSGIVVIEEGDEIKLEGEEEDKSARIGGVEPEDMTLL